MWRVINNDMSISSSTCVNMLMHAHLHTHVYPWSCKHEHTHAHILYIYTHILKREGWEYSSVLECLFNMESEVGREGLCVPSAVIVAGGESPSLNPGCVQQVEFIIDEHLCQWDWPPGIQPLSQRKQLNMA